MLNTNFVSFISLSQINTPARVCVYVCLIGCPHMLRHMPHVFISNEYIFIFFNILW